MMFFPVACFFVWLVGSNQAVAWEATAAIVEVSALNATFTVVQRRLAASERLLQANEAATFSDLRASPDLSVPGVTYVGEGGCKDSQTRRRGYFATVQWDFPDPDDGTSWGAWAETCAQAVVAAFAAAPNVVVGWSLWDHRSSASPSSCAIRVRRSQFLLDPSAEWTMEAESVLVSAGAAESEFVMAGASLSASGVITHSSGAASSLCYRVEETMNPNSLSLAEIFEPSMVQWSSTRPHAGAHAVSGSVLSFDPCDIDPGCSPVPVVTADIVLPFQVQAIWGSYVQRSTGENHADDCADRSSPHQTWNPVLDTCCDGYVMFGTPDQVMIGGCENGENFGEVTTYVPRTVLENATNTLRFAGAQNNHAESFDINISGIQLEMAMTTAPTTTTMTTATSPIATSTSTTTWAAATSTRSSTESAQAPATVQSPISPLSPAQPQGAQTLALTSATTMTTATSPIAMSTSTTTWAASTSTRSSTESALAPAPAQSPMSPSSPAQPTGAQTLAPTSATTMTTATSPIAMSTSTTTWAASTSTRSSTESAQAPATTATEPAQATSTQAVTWATNTRRAHLDQDWESWQEGSSVPSPRTSWFCLGVVLLALLR